MSIANTREFVSPNGKAKFTLNIMPWSGTVCKRNDNNPGGSTYFILTLDAKWKNTRSSDSGTYNEGYFKSIGDGDTPNAYASYNSNGQVIAISIENFMNVGAVVDCPESETFAFSARGRKKASVGGDGGWGYKEGDSSMHSSHEVTPSNIYIKGYETKNVKTGSVITSDTGTRDIDSNIPGMRTGIAQSPVFMVFRNDPVNPMTDNEWSEGTWNVTMTTDLPVFETDADLMEWVNGGCTDPSKMLNNGDPASEVDITTEYRTLYSEASINGQSVSTDYYWRFVPNEGSDDRICFVKSTDQYGNRCLRLQNYSDYTIYRSKRSTLDSAFELYTGSTAVLNRDWYPREWYSSPPMGTSPARYPMVSVWSTTIPYFNSQSEADDYIDDITDITSASNWLEILRQLYKYIDPNIGSKDLVPDNGGSKMVFGGGIKQWVLTPLKMKDLTEELMSPGTLSDIVAAYLGTDPIFGGNAMNAFLSLMYFPFDVRAVCTLNSNGEIPVKVGGYTADVNAPYVTRNDVLIDCGSEFIPDTFKDFRSFEPYTLMFISLPYVGLKPLTLYKYVGHMLSVKYAVDITTGACTAYLYTTDDSNHLVLADSFDGTIGASVPFTSMDHMAYLQSIWDGVSKVASIPIDSTKHALNSLGGAASGNLSSLMNGVGAELEVMTEVPRMCFGALEVARIAGDPPMQAWGGYGGRLGQFGNQMIHIIVCQKLGIVPENRESILGYPSNQGGAVSSFGGYLECSQFQFSNGFNGTEAERAEIVSIMQGGVYVQ